MRNAHRTCAEEVKYYTEHKSAGVARLYHSDSWEHEKWGPDDYH